MLRKLIITPYFGQFPEWMDLFMADYSRYLKPNGYDWILDTDLKSFKDRVNYYLEIEYPGERGNPKVWDYRCALGLLYERELKGYDYWGHMDFDMVFGDVTKFLPDSSLKMVDVFSGHNTYVCGCFSLYKNIAEVNNLFKKDPNRIDNMTNPVANGWVEQSFSRTLEASSLRYAYTFWQGNPYTPDPVLKRENKSLLQLMSTGQWEEVMFFHFRHSKQWPL